MILSYGPLLVFNLALFFVIFWGLDSLFRWSKYPKIFNIAKNLLGRFNQKVLIWCLLVMIQLCFKMRCIYLEEGIYQFQYRLLVFGVLFVLGLWFSISKRSLHEAIFRDDIVGYYIFELVNYVLWLITLLSFLDIFFDDIPKVILSSLGALSALVIFVFRDVILSLIAGLTVFRDDLVQKGTWIEMPQFSADGVVKEITSTRCVVRNWDNSLVIIPLARFLDHSFSSWKHLQDIQARRIIFFLSVSSLSVRLVEENRTNFENFLDKARQYLLDREDILNTSTCTLNLHSEPYKDGLVVKVYCYSSEIRWVPFEKIRLEVFNDLYKIGLAEGLVFISQGHLLSHEKPV